MNENINLCEILKDCPFGTKLYSIVIGEVEFVQIDNDKSHCPIVVYNNRLGVYFTYTKEGFCYAQANGGECLLLPSKDQRDWSKWKCPKQKFDPKTLKPFDKVLIRDYPYDEWNISFFSHIHYGKTFEYYTINCGFKRCIPYNEDTKHLVGTSEDAPEFYKYWED